MSAQATERSEDLERAEAILGRDFIAEMHRSEERMRLKAGPLCEADIRGVEAFSGDFSAKLAREHGYFPLGVSTRIARMRRGKWVKIPEAWRGKTVSAEQIRKRPSKRSRKARRGQRAGILVKGEERLAMDERRAPHAEDFTEELAR